MSKAETQITKGFWQSQAIGVFIPEYPLVRRGHKDRSPRSVDAIILPNEQHRQATFSDYPSLNGRDVIVVQTKTDRMGMYLMGQALFSGRLAMAQGARSVRSILLCQYTDAALLPLLSSFPEVEVWLSDPDNPMTCRRVHAGEMPPDWSTPYTPRKRAP